MIERVQRAGPVLRRAAVLEESKSGPGSARLHFRSLLRGQQRCIGIISALRLDIETSKSEQSCIVARAHVAERALGRHAVARHLRRLRRQQQGKGVAR